MTHLIQLFLGHQRACINGKLSLLLMNIKIYMHLYTLIAYYNIQI